MLPSTKGVLRPQHILPLLLAALFAGPALAQWDELINQLDTNNATNGAWPLGDAVADFDGESDVYGTVDRLVMSNGVDLWQTYTRAAGSAADWAFEFEYIGASCDLSDNSSWIASGDPLDADAFEGQPAVDIWEDTGAGITYRTTLVHPTDSSYLTEYGASVAVSGDLLIVGSPGSDEVFVYREASAGAGTGWALEGTFGESNGPARLGHSVAVTDSTPAGSGGLEVFIVGAPMGDPEFLGTFPGYVGIVRFDDVGANAWIVDSQWWSWAPGARTGWAVGIDNETAIMGAPNESDGLGGERGAAYVLRFDPGQAFYDVSTYVLPPQIVHVAIGKTFGSSVSIEEPHAFVGVPGHIGNGEDTGVFSLTGLGGGVYLRDDGSGFYEAPAGGAFYSLRKPTDALSSLPLPTLLDGFGSAATLYEDGSGNAVFATVPTPSTSSSGQVFVYDYLYNKPTWLWEQYLGGSVGSFGFGVGPSLRGEGSWEDGEPLRISLGSGPDSSENPAPFAFLVVGLAHANIPFFYGGTLVPEFSAPLGTFLPVPYIANAVPRILIEADLPAPSTLPAGTEIYLQFWLQQTAPTFILDPPFGWWGSNGLKGTVP